MSKETKRWGGLKAVATVVLLAATSAQAEIQVYSEVNGRNVAALTGNGNLLGTLGEFSGKNISAVSASQWMGVENAAFSLINSAGFLEGYYAYGVNGTPYYGKSSTKFLTGGDLAGQLVQNANYLGATNDVRYYVDNSGVSRYSDIGTNTVLLNLSWTKLSGGGSLNGSTMFRGIGLLDMGGNTDISDNYLMNVAPDGTLEYYFMDNGVYAAGLEATYGSWQVFTQGKLAGLTLSQLAAAPVGTINGYAYRYLGNGDDSMYFDVQVAPVPEPATLATMGLGLLGIAMLRSRRRKGD